MSFTSYTQYYNSLIEPQNKFYFRGGSLGGDVRGLQDDFFSNAYQTPADAALRTSANLVVNTLNRNTANAINLPQLKIPTNNLYICGGELGLSSGVGIVILYDRLLTMRYNAAAATATTINNFSATTRYSADTRLLVFVQANATVSPIRFYTINYTNQDGVSGRIGRGEIGDNNVISLLQTGFGTFTNLQSGDTGVRSVQSISINGAADLLMSIVKPIAILSAYGTQNSSQSSIPNLINGGLNGGLPIIDENSCLSNLRAMVPPLIRLTQAASTQQGALLGNLIITEA